VKASNIIRLGGRVPWALGGTMVSHNWLVLRKKLKPEKYGQRRSMDIISAWGAFLCRAMGIEVVKRNERSGPMGDVIIANHMGFLDVPVLLSFYPAVFIIKAEMLRVFYFGKALEDHGHVFVDRKSSSSRRGARDGVRKVLEEGDRIIVFPEGRASPGSKRLPFKPFCFFEAARQNKRIEACIIDYVPREELQWDIKRPMIPQLVDLIGRKKTQVSVEFLPSELINDPEEAAERYHDIIERKLEEYEAER